MKVVMGGSFDPVHIGHLRIATELAELLESRVDLMPCNQAVHKAPQGASVKDRLAMLSLSTEDNDWLSIDEREIHRADASYTITSLKEIREQLGDEPLIFVMGSDSAASIHTWKNASEYSKLTHIVVLRRPGLTQKGSLASFQATFESLGFVFSEHVSDLKQRPSGLFTELKLSELEISSRYIRSCVKQKRSIRYIVSGEVEQYICDNNLYI